MADDLDAEYRAMIDKAPETATLGEEEAEPAGKAEGGDTSTPPPADAQAEADAASAADAAKPKGEDLPLDEIRKRWEDQKGLNKKEREQRRAAEAKAEQAAAQVAQMQAQMQQLMARMQAGQSQIPNPEEDVVGTVKALQAQLQAAQHHQAQQAQQRAQIDHQTRVAKSIQDKVADFESEFQAEHPDYDEALEHVLDTKEAEFELAGYPKELAQKHAAQWAMNAAAAMLQTGRNPAEAGYALAKRMGFVGKAGVTTQSDPAIAATQQAAAASAQKLAQIKDGQSATSRMSGGGGANNGYDGTLKSIVDGNLSGAALDAAMDKFLRDATRG